MFFRGAPACSRSSRPSPLLAIVPLLVVVACTGNGDRAPQVTTTSLPAGTTGTAYHAELAATGLAPIVWTVAGGALPNGLALALDGTLQGTPTVAGTFAFTVTATNAVGSDAQDLAVDIAVPTVAPVITGPALPLGDATVGIAWTTTFTATGTAPIAWSVAAGTLPAGFTLDAGTGTLAGTPTTAGSVAFTIAADNVAGTDTLACALTVLAVPTPPTITGPTSPLPTGGVNIAYSQTLTASGTQPITWSVSAGTLPTGLSLDANTGELAGTPTLAESRTFSITATNTHGSDTAAFQLTTAHLPTLSSLTPASGVAGGSIRLGGTGFATSTSGNTVHFGSAVANVLTASATELLVQVPTGLASTATVTVTTGSATTSGRTFTLDTTSVVFVAAGAAGNDDGTSWSDAFASLQDALAVATSGQEIWIAAGTYKPGTATSDWFAPNSQRLYGGFAGDEALRSQQNALAHATILSGDVLGDSVGLTNLTDNNEHVVMATGSCVLDGLRVTQGHSSTSGGGIHASAGSLTLHDVEVYENSAAGDGGGVFVADVILAVQGCTIRDNVSAASGGGIAIEHSSSTTLGSLSRVALARNTAAIHGGGCYDTELVGCTNVVVVGNSAGNSGGGYYKGTQNANLVHVTLVGNDAVDGGGFCGKGQLTNCIVWGNTATGSGDDIRTLGDTTVLGLVIATTITGLGTLTQSNVLAGDPLFVAAGDPDGADDRFRTADDGLAIDAGSSALDAGTAVFVVEDVLGAARPVGTGFDIGAYERQ